jgi:hypothetical protein
LIQKIDTIQLAINEHFAEPIEKGKGRQRRSIDLKALKGQKGKGNNPASFGSCSTHHVLF